MPAPSMPNPPNKENKALLRDLLPYELTSQRFRICKGPNHLISFHGSFRWEVYAFGTVGIDSPWWWFWYNLESWKQHIHIFCAQTIPELHWMNLSTHGMFSLNHWLNSSKVPFVPSVSRLLGQHEVGTSYFLVQGNKQQPMGQVSGIAEVGNIPRESM